MVCARQPSGLISYLSPVLPGIFIFVVMKKQMNLRSMAAQAVEQVIEQGQSLSNILPPLQQKVLPPDWNLSLPYFFRHIPVKKL